MCGITGIVSRRADHLEAIHRALHALRHRGPDDEGIYVGAEVALGQRRLSIIDLKGGRQPIANEDQSAWIVCNGEIYNYKELRRGLEQSGHRFATHSDTEVILHLYEQYGECCLQRLRGMFAFAIWDQRKRTLFAARDHLGQKPLFYREGAGELMFASELKGLLAMQEAPAEPDLDALHQYLALRIVAAPLTMFRGIRKLPPAHFLVFGEHSGLRIERYWDLEYEPKLTGSENELLEQLHDVLIESVKLHMVSDVPVGAFLSGGLDSTLVLALAMTHAAVGAMPSFTLGLPYREFDEAPYARMVAQRYGTRHHEASVVPSLIDNLPALVDALDEPSDPLSVATYLISEIASRHVKVVLGGDGGDELFGGYDRYYGNLYAGYYALLPAALRRAVLGPLLELLPDGGWYKSIAHQLKWLHSAALATGGERYAQTLGYFYFDADLRTGVYGPRLLQAAARSDPFAAIRTAYERAPAEHPVDKMLYADSQIRLPDHPVMILDRTSMAHGLEARSPFMDHKLAEFAAGLPTHLKVRWRTKRYIQLRLAERYLPQEVLHREKQGFTSALPYLLGDEYRRLFRDLLGNSRLARDGILHRPGIDRLLEEHQGGKTDHGNRLWLLANSEAWYRMRILGETQEQLAAQIGGKGSRRAEFRPRAPSESLAADLG
jgi:asparagine synthase (glutamine-hydrolysing)